MYIIPGNRKIHYQNYLSPTNLQNLPGFSLRSNEMLSQQHAFCDRDQNVLFIIVQQGQNRSIYIEDLGTLACIIYIVHTTCCKEKERCILVKLSFINKNISQLFIGKVFSLYVLIFFNGLTPPSTPYIYRTNLSLHQQRRSEPPGPQKVPLLLHCSFLSSS